MKDISTLKKCLICGRPSGDRQMCIKCETEINRTAMLAEQLKKVG